MEKSVTQQSQKNLLDRTVKGEPIKTNSSFTQERKTMVKGLKPAPIGPSITTNKTDGKQEKKGIGIGITQPIKESSRQIFKVE
jgi:hypothetical protein